MAPSHPGVRLGLSHANEPNAAPAEVAEVHGRAVDYGPVPPTVPLLPASDSGRDESVLCPSPTWPVLWHLRGDRRRISGTRRGEPKQQPLGRQAVGPNLVT